jgi:uncharacterized protein (TIRG00374 family)
MDSLSASPHLPARRSWLLTQFAVGLLIGALTLAWAMRGLDLRLVLRSLVTAHYAWVLISCVCVIGVALSKAVRWSALYSVSERRTPFSEVFSALIISQMVNVVIPIRMGELVRIGLMKQSGQPGATTLSTIVVEKSFDLVAAGLMALSMVTLAMAPAWLSGRAVGLFVIGLALVVGLALVWYLRVWVEKVLARVLTWGGWLPQRWQTKLLCVTHSMLDAFGTLTNLGCLARVLFWTTMAWLLSLMNMLTLFAAFELNLPVAAGVVLIITLLFSNIAPSPPALIGVMHAIAVVVLGEYGVSQTVAMGFGILLNVITVAPLIMIGSIALWQRAAFLLRVLRGHSMRELLKKLAASA